MKHYLFILVLLVLAACNPKESNDKDSQSSKTKITEKKSVDKISKNNILPSDISTENVFVSWNGKCTNLVFDADHDKFLIRDNRTPEELQKEIDANPENPDVWFALAKCFWDRYDEVDNAYECFQKAHELAPDALMPRLYLAGKEMAQLNFDEGIKIFRESYFYAKNNKDRERFADVITDQALLYTQNDFKPDWAINLLKEIADDTPYAYKYIAEIYAYSERENEALPWIKQGLSATTNIEFQKFRNIKNEKEKDEEFEASYKKALEKSAIPEFDKAIIAIDNVGYYEKEEKYPELCRYAASLATNCNQKIIAFQELAELYADNVQKEKLKNLVEEIFGTNNVPAEHAVEIADLLSRVNLTNEATKLLKTAILKDTNEYKVAEMMLTTAKQGNEIDENIILELTKRFPSNAIVCESIADFFSENDWFDKEIEFREKALAFSTKPLKQNYQVTFLIKRYLRFDKIAEAENLISTYSNVLSNNANLALNLSKIYCKKGQTNDAFEIIISQCQAAKYERDKEELITKLLEFKWPEKSMRKRAAHFAWETVEQLSIDCRYDRNVNIYNLLIESYISLNQPDDALKACQKVFILGGAAYNFDKVCILINDPLKIEIFVRNILSEGSSQTHFYSTVAKACEQAHLPELACELFVKAWEISKENHDINSAFRAVRLADELKNEELCNKILYDLIEICKSEKTELYDLWSVNEFLKQFDKKEQYEEIATLIIEKSKGRKRMQAIYHLAWWYMENNKTSEVEKLIAQHFEGQKFNIGESLNQLYFYKALGKKLEYKTIINKFEKATHLN